MCIGKTSDTTTKNFPTAEVSGTSGTSVYNLGKYNIFTTFERCLSFTNLYYLLNVGLETTTSTRIRQTTTSHQTPCKTDNSTG